MAMSTFTLEFDAHFGETYGVESITADAHALNEVTRRAAAMIYGQADRNSMHLIRRHVTAVTVNGVRTSVAEVCAALGCTR